MGHRTSVVVLGGGPGGYEAALVAARLGATVTVVDRDGLGGACVLTDCVPSKTLISTAEVRDEPRRRLPTSGSAWPEATVGPGRGRPPSSSTWPRPRAADIAARLDAVTASGSCAAPGALVGAGAVARGAGSTAPWRTSTPRWCCWPPGRRPATVPTGPAGRRADPHLAADLHARPSCPSTSSWSGPASPGPSWPTPTSGSAPRVTLVSSRDRVLPGEDADAAAVIEDVFRRDGMEVLGRSRMASGRADRRRGMRDARRRPRRSRGSHALLAVGSVAQTAGIGLGGERDRADRVRPHRGRQGLADLGARACTRPGTAPASCRWRRWRRCRGGSRCAHALGDAVAPLRLDVVSANIFTSPEIATVGITQDDVDERARRRARGDAAAGHQPARQDGPGHATGSSRCSRQQGSGTVLGGVVVAPRASRAHLPADRRGPEPPQRRPAVEHLHHLPVDVGLDRRGGPPPALDRGLTPPGGCGAGRGRSPRCSGSARRPRGPSAPDDRLATRRRIQRISGQRMARMTMRISRLLTENPSHGFWSAAVSRGIRRW